MEKEKSADIIKFLNYFADFYHLENDLSNITYLLCKSDDEFRRFFLSFCFDEQIDVLNFDNFRREVKSQNGQSRVDFHFFDEKEQERLIEVKIWDGNLHDEYVENFPKAKRCFLSAYRLGFDRIGWKQKTWGELCKQIDSLPLRNNELIIAYENYIKKLINIKEFEHMEFDLSFPVKFINNIDNILAQKYQAFPGSSTFSQKKYGRNYVIKRKEEVYFWIGLYYEEKMFFISIDNINDNLERRLESLTNETDIYKFEYDDTLPGYFFTPKKIQIKEFCEKNEEEQKKILEDFIEAVFKDVGILEEIK